jgi:hypothetical protein
VRLNKEENMGTITNTEVRDSGTVTTTHEFKDVDLWSAFWGSGFESDPVTRNYLMTLDFIEGDWETLGVAEVGYVDEEDPNEGDDEDAWLTKRLNIEDITTALSKAMNEGYHHVPCGGKITADFDDWDACISDIILQLALYGKEVWA